MSLDLLGVSISALPRISCVKKLDGQMPVVGLTTLIDSVLERLDRLADRIRSRPIA
jgi:hypothetical protein